jgi:DNA (cytosine-5)-methyltransferase 1
MNRPLVYGSICSGIEAATVAWHPLGWMPSFFSEIDNFPRAVLHHHYPDVPLHGDFTTIGKDTYDPIDLLVGGTPCQDFSVAGLRKGLAGERGNLTLEFIRLAQRLRPKWLVWENVPGVLSIDRGRAFGSFLGGMAELGYGFAYRVLDAQHFGVPQRRRRVFVVGYLGDWRPAAAVLFESESLRRDLTPSRETGKAVAALTANGVGTCGADDNQGQAGHLIASPLCARNQSRGVDSDCTATLVTHSLRADGFDASEDGTGRGTPLVPVIAPCLTGNYGKQPDNSDTSHGPMLVPVPILEAGARTGISTNDPRAGIGIGEPGDPMFTLQAGKQHAIGFDCKASGRNGFGVGNMAPTLRAMTHAGSHANAGGQVAVAFAQNTRDEVRLIGGDGQVVGSLAADAGMKQQSYVAFDLRDREGGAMPEGPHDTANIRAASGGSSRSYIAAPMQVRRLTPRECERLQGFPDNYTLVPYRGKVSADGPRYKALGNSMAVPCMHWLGERIQKVEDLMAEPTA